MSNHDEVCARVAACCSTPSDKEFKRNVQELLCAIADAQTNDYEIVCASTDGRLLLFDATTLALTELDGSPILDGATAVNCDNEYKYIQNCYQDITDPTIRYTQLVCINVNDPTANLVIIYFAADGTNLGTTQPINSEPCDPEPLAHSSTANAPDSATVGVASVSVLPANPNRRGLTLTNDNTTETIYIAFGAPAVVGSGTPLKKDGGNFSMGAFDFTTQEVFAIATAAGVNLSIQEYE